MLVSYVNYSLYKPSHDGFVSCARGDIRIDGDGFPVIGKDAERIVA